MSDAAKRKIIHFLNRFDSLTMHGHRNSGWNPTKAVYDEYNDAEELKSLSGKELNRELRTQIIMALPVLLFLLFCAAAIVFGLFFCI